MHTYGGEGQENCGVRRVGGALRRPGVRTRKQRGVGGCEKSEVVFQRRGGAIAKRETGRGQRRRDFTKQTVRRWLSTGGWCLTERDESGARLQSAEDEKRGGVPRISLIEDHGWRNQPTKSTSLQTGSKSLIELSNRCRNRPLSVGRTDHVLSESQIEL
ncbi:transcriptional regulator [Striga asiatica]|uniref:Transcriptional regulator n=1 Tax=Striga asiatica TaxID=4170 RepID=A0A5A7QLX3_STRAF|nr:transcriptional regulator [Striga asiatica]